MYGIKTIFYPKWIIFTHKTEKSVELRTINRKRKLVSKINSALEKLKNKNENEKE